jgi:hypothetical protein
MSASAGFFMRLNEPAGLLDGEPQPSSQALASVLDPCPNLHNGGGQIVGLDV